MGQQIENSIARISLSCELAMVVDGGVQSVVNQNSETLEAGIVDKFNVQQELKEYFKRRQQFGLDGCFAEMAAAGKEQAPAKFGGLFVHLSAFLLILRRKPLDESTIDAGKGALARVALEGGKMCRGRLVLKIEDRIVGQVDVDYSRIGRRT